MSTCDSCSLDLSIARIRQNWERLGTLKQMSRAVGFPQEVLETIGSNVAYPFHTVTGTAKGRGWEEEGYRRVTHTLCRHCLAAGIACGLAQDERLPYLRYHMGYFHPPTQHTAPASSSEQFEKVLQCDLPEHYSCSYYRTQLPVAREGLPDQITPS